MEPGVKATGPALAPAHAFDIANVAKRLSEGSGGYEIVHASPGIEVGVYVLVAPEPDRQQPHEDDEVYVVLEGNGVLEIEGERVELREGHAVFVPAGAEHQFVAYEHLIVLVIFERRGRERVSAMTSITTASEQVARVRARLASCSTASVKPSLVRRFLESADCTGRITKETRPRGDSNVFTTT